MTLKLGPHMLPHGDDTTRAWLALKPTVAKFVNAFGLEESAAPETLCIGRVVDDWDVNAHTGEDPAAAAQDYYNRYLAQMVAERPRLKVIEVCNEQHPENDQAHHWFGAFLYFAAGLLHAQGRRAGLGNWATGTPEIDKWGYYMPMLRATREFGAIHQRHDYGPLDGWLSLRYRRDQAEFARLGFPNVPTIISECGADNVGGQTPWMGAYWGGSMQRYWNELIKPYMDEIAKDTYVLGATLFSVGDGESGGWRAFDVSGTDIVERVANWQSPVPNPAPPTGGSTMPPYPTGKGMFIWQLKNCAGGDPARLADMAAAAGIKWVSIKIADGIVSFNGDVGPAVRALKAAGISVWGWSYVYGYRPEDEAHRAIDRCNSHGLDGYHLNAEHEYKQAGRAVMAKRMMDVFRMSAPALPVGLCSYRYPSLHGEFPWAEFLDGCTHHAPQVYWLENDSSLAPGEQLARSVRELKLKRDLPIVPLGVASPNDAGTWLPSIPQLDNFHAAVKATGLPGWGYWSWEHAERRSEVWQAIAQHSALTPAPPVPTMPPEGDDSMDEAKRLAILEHVRAIEALLATAPVPTPGPAVLFRVHILVSALNVRAGPAATFNVIGNVTLGQELNVWEVAANGWYRIHVTEQRWISGAPAFSVQVLAAPEPISAPPSTAPDMRGLRVDEWHIEKTTVGVGEDCWFNFTVVNKQPQGLPLTVAVLGAYADDGTVAPSFTHYTLSPSAVLTHRDHINFGTPGTKQVRLGVKWSDNDTAFVRLSGPFTVTVA